MANKTDGVSGTGTDGGNSKNCPESVPLTPITVPSLVALINKNTGSGIPGILTSTIYKNIRDFDGEVDGKADGDSEGDDDGEVDGDEDGEVEGDKDGDTDGDDDGDNVGLDDGNSVGKDDLTNEQDTGMPGMYKLCPVMCTDIMHLPLA